jgi:hypothetical protein
VGEIVSDTRYGPLDLPADAILVCCWDQQAQPACWDLVGVATGYKTLDDAIAAAVTAYPEHSGKAWLATKVGGAAGRVQVGTRTESLSYAAQLQDPTKKLLGL